MSDEKQQEELAGALPEEIDEESVNDHDSWVAAPDQGETLSDEEVLIAEESEFAEEIGLSDETAAAGLPEFVARAEESVNGHDSWVAAPDQGETPSDEEVLTTEESEFGEEIGLSDETAAAGLPEFVAQAEESVNGHDSWVAAPDQGETLSDEEVLITEESEFAEEIGLSDETAAAGLPEFVARAEESVNDHDNSAAAPDQGEAPSDEEVLITEESEFAEEIELSDETAAARSSESVAQAEDEITATREEIKPAIEALLFVAEEPLPFKTLCKLLGDVSEEDVRAALDELVADYEARKSGLEIREIAGGWRISTRPQNHDFIRKYLKSRPSARLSLPALETLAVIAYKQPITIPEILEIRGVTSSSAIKTLLEKRLIVTKGRKETVGRPMLYGTSKEFLIQFGLRDLSELPSIEDFEDLAQ
jgi:segregation and condensation protein B